LRSSLIFWLASFDCFLASCFSAFNFATSKRFFALNFSFSILILATSALLSAIFSFATAILAKSFCFNEILRSSLSATLLSFLVVFLAGVFAFVDFEVFLMLSFVFFVAVF